MGVQSQSACACVYVYVREHVRMGGQVFEYVYLHTCVYQGMTNEISSPDIR